MKHILSSLVLLYLFCSTTPITAQTLTLDQLFWLRERSEGDNSEWLTIEHNWRFEKNTPTIDSLSYSTSWFFQNARKKRTAKLTYENRGSSNITTITYSTINKQNFNAIKARLAAYQMKYISQENDKGMVQSHYRDNDFDIILKASASSEAVSATWYTIIVRPRWH